jgi:hypothetical protein
LTEQFQSVQGKWKGKNRLIGSLLQNGQARRRSYPASFPFQKPFETWQPPSLAPWEELSIRFRFPAEFVPLIAAEKEVCSTELNGPYGS